jgi:flavodoxin
MTRACVVYDSRFGNTERIAKALEAGLREAGVETTCAVSRDVKPDSLMQYDLVCIGAPTEAFSAFKPTKEFLGRLEGASLSGKRAFAFDTRVDWRLSGSAAKYIEKELEGLGLQIAAPRESAFVSTVREGGTITGAKLKKGEEKRFEEVGRKLGEAEVKGRPIPA